MKLKAILPLGCSGMAIIFAILIGLAWITGNIRPMTEQEKQAVEDRIKANQPPPSSPTPRPWPVNVPRTGAALADPWRYAEDRVLENPRHCFLEDARYRMDDRDAARAALLDGLRYHGLEEMPQWQDAVNAVVKSAGVRYEELTRDEAHGKKIGDLLEDLYLRPTVIVKGPPQYPVVLVHYGIFPGRVSYIGGRHPGWRVEHGTHQDPVPTHWGVWKSDELAAALLVWGTRYPDSKMFVLRFTDAHLDRPRRGYYVWRRNKGQPASLTYWQPDDLGEMGDPFDPKSGETEPRYVSSRFQPISRNVSEEDLAAAVAGKLDLNELFFHLDSMAPMPRRALTPEEREAIVREVLGKAAESLRKARDQ